MITTCPIAGRKSGNWKALTHCSTGIHHYVTFRYHLLLKTKLEDWLKCYQIWSKANLWLQILHASFEVEKTISKDFLGYDMEGRLIMKNYYPSSVSDSDVKDY